MLEHICFWRIYLPIIGLAIQIGNTRERLCIQAFCIRQTFADELSLFAEYKRQEMIHEMAGSPYSLDL